VCSEDLSIKLKIYTLLVRVDCVVSERINKAELVFFSFVKSVCLCYCKLK
jgi:hypothetical protein